MKSHLLTITIVLLSLLGFSQSKFEKETRAKVTEVPLSAIQFIDSLSILEKIKWFRETDLEKNSYEAKFKYNSNPISIEFLEQGLFEDMEVEVKANEIPLSILTQIKAHLDTTLVKYTIDKIQIQYKGTAASLQNYFSNQEFQAQIPPSYELVIITKINGEFIFYQCLFDAQGYFLHRQRILFQMTDNIEF